MKFASVLRVCGGQRLAKREIGASANADGAYGAPFIFGGTVIGTSIMNTGFCTGSGIGDIFEA